MVSSRVAANVELAREPRGRRSGAWIITWSQWPVLRLVQPVELGLAVGGKHDPPLFTANGPRADRVPASGCPPGLCLQKAGSCRYALSDSLSSLVHF